KEMFRFTQLGLATTEGRVRINELSGPVDCTTGLTAVTVLLLGTTGRTLPFDIAIGQKHPFDGVVELLDNTGFYKARCLEVSVNALRELDVFGRVGAMPVIKFDVEAV